MATTPHGRIDCKQTGGGTGLAMSQTHFISLYKGLKALAALGLMVEVSNSWGTGTGFNYPDEASPIGTSGHVLMRMPPTARRVYSLYVLLQFSKVNVASFKANNTTADTNYGSIAATFAAALDAGGADASPIVTSVAGGAGTYWGTSCDGADEIPTCDGIGKAKWVLPAGGKLWVADRSDNTGGGNATYKQDLSLMHAPASTALTTRWSVICDEDSIVFITDKNDDTPDNMVGCFLFNPDADFSAIVPFRHFGMKSSLSSESYYIEAVLGYVDSTGTEEICIPFTAIGEGKIGSMWNGASRRSTYNPNSLTSRYSDGQLDLAVLEGANCGVVGTVDTFMGLACNLAPYNTLNTKSRILVGGTTLSQAKLTFPWDGATTPQTAGSTRDGVDF